MDSRKFKKRIQHRLYHACTNECDSDSEVDGLSTSSLPLTETCMEYFQDSFPGSEGLGRLDMPMAATITKRNQVSPCSVVLSMMYAKRLRQQNKQYLHSMSSTDVFFISMMMASKYLYDEGVDEEVYNDEWAASVGHEMDDVNQMEMDFLKEMDWHLFATHEDFDKALTAVERRLALTEGVKRGWFTYTEMAVLLDWDPVWNLWNQVGVDCTKMVSLLSAVYVTSVVSMMGSAAIAFQLSGPMASATIAAAVSLHTSISSTTRPTLPSVSITVHHHQCNGSSMEMMGDLENGVTPTEVLPLVSSQQKELETGFVAGSVEENRSRFNDDGDMVTNYWSESPIDYVERSAQENRDEEGIEKGATLSKMKLKQATSVFSMWLFDSLISQVWSVFDSSMASTATAAANTDQDGKHPHQKEQQNNVWSFEDGDVISEKKACCENCGNSGERRRHRCKGGNKSRKRHSNSYSPTFRHRHGVSPGIRDGDVDMASGTDRLDVCIQGYASGLMRDFGAITDCVIATTTTTTTTASLPCKGCGEKKCLLGTISDTTSCQCSSSSFSPSSDCDCDRCTTNPLYQDTPDKAHTGHSVDNFSVSHHGIPPTTPENKDHRNNNNKNNIDLTLPLSLMTEVPILDPIGFFTKNSPSPSYVLST